MDVDKSIFTTTAEVVSELLQTTFKEYSIQMHFAELLRILSKLAWLKIDDKGCVFLLNKHNELVMIAHKNFNKNELTTCAKVAAGQCYCGKAAALKTIVYRDNNEHIGVEFQGETTQKHYSIPLLAGKELLGVVVLYFAEEHNPQEEEKSFLTFLSTALSTVIGKKILEEKFKINQFRAEYFQRELLHKLVIASEFRDNETGNHVRRVTDYAVLLGKKLNLSNHQIELLKNGIPLHDVGKIAIQDSILLKPDKLTKAEFDIIKTHTTAGANLLKETTSEYLEVAKDIALSHHEKWDGSGYPRGLKREEIPLFARICAVADVFDALSSARPYKQAWALDDILNLLKKESGKHFDPNLIEIFLDSIDEVLQIQSLYQDAVIDIEQREIGIKFANQDETFVAWSDNLLTGIDVVDNEHKYLIRLINNLYSNIEHALGIETIIATLRELREYTFIHFRDEEKILKKYKYNDIKHHIRLHRFFEKRLEIFENEIMEMPFLIGFEILDFLKDWLVKHILLVDTKIKENLEGLQEIK